VRDQLWTAEVLGVVSRKRPHGPALVPSSGPGVGIAASAYSRLTNDVRLVRACGFDARPTSLLVMKPTIQTAQERAEKRDASGPYPWRPPE
jgi:hypothetical protein